ncbi:hypothetical protein GCM10028807_44760 [Spirosoma daeguense]
MSVCLSIYLPDKQTPLNLLSRTSLSLNETTAMATNTLVIITGYVSIKPKPHKRAYLNTSIEEANQRFKKEYPQARDITTVSVLFDDEFIISGNGDISSDYY